VHNQMSVYIPAATNDKKSILGAGVDTGPCVDEIGGPSGFATSVDASACLAAAAHDNNAFAVRGLAEVAVAATLCWSTWLRASGVSACISAASGAPA
jgi:hypothetical protein